MSLFKRDKSPYYWMQFRVGGKLIRRSTGTTRKAEAEKIHAKVYSDLINQKWGILESKTITFRDFVRDHFLPYSVANKRESTVDKLKWHLRNIEAFLADDILISAIDAGTIERYKQSRLADGVQSSTLNSEVNTFRAVVNYAIELKYRIEPLPVRLLKEPKSPPKAFTPEEARRILSAARSLEDVQSPRAFLLVAIPLYTGLRKQELFHLQWRDVDFERSQLLVRPKSDWMPKDYEQRAIPMSAHLGVDLVKYYEMDGERVSFHVIRTGKNRPYRTNADRILKTIATRAEVETLTLHMLRHTFATNLIDAGSDISTVSELLGHSSVRMTEKYLHLSKEHFHREVGRLPY